MKLLAGTLSKGISVRNSQGMVGNLSKALELGCKYRLFLPVVKDELGDSSVAIAAVPGRRCDGESLGNIYFVTLRDFEVEGSGRIKDNTGLASYARISKVLYDAAYKAAVTAKEREAKAIADELGTKIDETALKQSLRELELQYYGDRTSDPVIYANKNQLISGVVVEIATEGLLVPLDDKGAPLWGKSQSISIPVSNRKATQITSLMSNTDYYDGENDFLEIHLDYSGKDKKTASADLAFNGVSSQISLKSKFNDSWEANKSALDRLPRTGEQIAARNMSMSSSTTAQDVVTAFEKFISKNQLVLVNIDMEADLTKKAAKDLITLTAIKNVPKVYNKLEELAADAIMDGEDEGEEDANNKGADVEGAIEAKTVADVEATGYDTEGAGQAIKEDGGEGDGQNDPFAGLR